MNIEPFYKKNISYFKTLSHILYFSLEDNTTSIDPYSNQNNTIHTLKIFDKFYKTINLDDFFYSIFYLLVPSYIEFSQELVAEFYDQALKDYDHFDLFKQFQYRHKYNKQTVRNFLRQKTFNLFMLQFCADYLDINIIIIDNNCLNTIYSKNPTPYKSHIILMKNGSSYQPIFQEKKYIFTSRDQITWIAFRNYIISETFKKIN